MVHTDMFRGRESEGEREDRKQSNRARDREIAGYERDMEKEKTQNTVMMMLIAFGVSGGHNGVTCLWG